MGDGPECVRINPNTLHLLFNCQVNSPISSLSGAAAAHSLIAVSGSIYYYLHCMIRGGNDSIIYSAKVTELFHKPLNKHPYCLLDDRRSWRRSSACSLICSWTTYYYNVEPVSLPSTPSRLSSHSRALCFCGSSADSSAT